MNTLAQSTKQNKNAPTSSASSLLVQRKCACGGVSKLGGQCSQCESKKLVGGNAPLIQPKLKIGQSNDKYEQEADRVADQVMRMPEPKENNATQGKTITGRTKTGLLTGNSEISIQRQEEDILQAKATPGYTPQVTSKVAANIQNLRGGGLPLPPNQRHFFESRMGQDFSAVRIHADSKAADAAQAIQARAFTLGNNIVFNASQYSPDNQEGKKLLAHELTHVVQQGQSQGSSNSAAAAETEADHAAIQAVMGQSVTISAGVPVGVQCKPLREEELELDIANLNQKIAENEALVEGVSLPAAEEQRLYEERNRWLEERADLQARLEAPTTEDPRLQELEQNKNSLVNLRERLAEPHSYEGRDTDKEDFVNINSVLEVEEERKRDEKRKTIIRVSRSISDVRLAKRIKNYRRKGRIKPFNEMTKFRFKIYVGEQKERISQKKNLTFLSKDELDDALASARRKARLSSWSHDRKVAERERKWLEAEKIRRRSRRPDPAINRNYLSIKKLSSAVDDGILSREKTEPFKPSPRYYKGLSYIGAESKDRFAFHSDKKWSNNEKIEQKGLLVWWYEMELEGKNKNEIVEKIDGYFLGQAEAHLRIQDAETQERFKDNPQSNLDKAIFDLSEPHFEHPLSPGYDLLNNFRYKLRMAKNSGTPEKNIVVRYDLYRKMQGGVTASRMGALGKFAAMGGSAFVALRLKKPPTRAQRRRQIRENRKKAKKMPGENAGRQEQTPGTKTTQTKLKKDKKARHAANRAAMQKKMEAKKGNQKRKKEKVKRQRRNKRYQKKNSKGSGLIDTAQGSTKGSNRAAIKPTTRSTTKLEAGKSEKSPPAQKPTAQSAQRTPKRPSSQSILGWINQRRYTRSFMKIIDGVEPFNVKNPGGTPTGQRQHDPIVQIAPRSSQARAHDSAPTPARPQAQAPTPARPHAQTPTPVRPQTQANTAGLNNPQGVVTGFDQIWRELNQEINLEPSSQRAAEKSPVAKNATREKKAANPTVKGGQSPKRSNENAPNVKPRKLAAGHPGYSATRKTLKKNKQSEPTVESSRSAQGSDLRVEADAETAVRIKAASRAEKVASKKGGDLPSSRKQKTVGIKEKKIAPGVRRRRTTISGWKEIPERSTKASPEGVAAHAEIIGHNLKPENVKDNAGGKGFSGKYNASHSEKQQSLANPNEPIGVSRPMCGDCVPYFQKEAQYRKHTQVVGDPQAVRVFEPDAAGTVTEFRKDGRVVRYKKGDEVTRTKKRTKKGDEGVVGEDVITVKESTGARTEYRIDGSIIRYEADGRTVRVEPPRRK